MEESRINTLIENIEIFLESNAKNQEEILQEFKSLKNDPKTAQILNEASERVNLSFKEIEGLISKEKHLIENFNPVVEVKHSHYRVEVNNPLAWILGAVLVMLISVFVCLWFYQSKQDIIKEKNYYKSQSDNKDWYYMEYKYLQLFGEKYIVEYLNNFDKEYRNDYKTYDEKVMQKEKQLKEAARARDIANMRAKEAERLRHIADSLNNIQ